MVAAVERLADELARSGRAETEERARAVGVQAAVPLGLCLLPAFVLIGIVPLVVALLDRPRPVIAAPPNRPPARLARRALHSAARDAAARPPRSPKVESTGRIGRPGNGGTHVSAIAAPAPAGSRASARDERGITTAEYAVGTAAGAGLAGLLYKLLTGGFGDQLLKTLFDHVLGLLGIG